MIRRHLPTELNSVLFINRCIWAGWAALATMTMDKAASGFVMCVLANAHVPGQIRFIQIA